MITEQDIVNHFFRNSRGIKATARHFSIPTSYAGKIINQYIKKHNIRF
jgi:hypothetical protein